MAKKEQIPKTIEEHLPKTIEEHYKAASLATAKASDAARDAALAAYNLAVTMDKVIKDIKAAKTLGWLE